MRAGRLRERVTIQAATRTANSFGEEAPAWNDAQTAWAEVRPMMATAREKMAPGAEILQARAPYQVRMRFFSGLSPVSHRLVWEGRTLEIESVLDPDGRRHEQVVLCWEVQGEGTLSGFPVEEPPEEPEDPEP